MRKWQLLLILVFGLRMLVPSGVCLCHLAEIAESHEEEEHTPSCPASPNANDWLQGQAVDLPLLDLSLSDPVLTLAELSGGDLGGFTIPCHALDHPSVGECAPSVLLI